MGTEENQDEPVNLIDEPSLTEAAEEEPIEEVMTSDISATEPSEPPTESEDRERFEETAKFEEEIEPTQPKR